MYATKTMLVILLTISLLSNIVILYYVYRQKGGSAAVPGKPEAEKPPLGFKQ